MIGGVIGSSNGRTQPSSRHAVCGRRAARAACAAVRCRRRASAGCEPLIVARPFIVQRRPGRRSVTLLRKMLVRAPRRRRARPVRRAGHGGRGARRRWRIAFARSSRSCSSRRAPVESVLDLRVDGPSSALSSWRRPVRRAAPWRPPRRAPVRRARSRRTARRRSRGVGVDRERHLEALQAAPDAALVVEHTAALLGAGAGDEDRGLRSFTAFLSIDRRSCGARRTRPSARPEPPTPGRARSSSPAPGCGCAGATFREAERARCGSTWMRARSCLRRSSGRVPHRAVVGASRPCRWKSMTIRPARSRRRNWRAISRPLRGLSRAWCPRCGVRGRRGWN